MSVDDKVWADGRGRGGVVTGLRSQPLGVPPVVSNTGALESFVFKELKKKTVILACIPLSAYSERSAGNTTAGELLTTFAKITAASVSGFSRNT